VRLAGQRGEVKVPCLAPRGETVRRSAVRDILCCKTRKIGHFRGKLRKEIRVVLLKLCLLRRPFPFGIISFFLAGRTQNNVCNLRRIMDLRKA